MATHLDHAQLSGRTHYRILENRTLIEMSGRQLCDDETPPQLNEE